MPVLVGNQLPQFFDLVQLDLGMCLLRCCVDEPGDLLVVLHQGCSLA